LPPALKHFFAGKWLPTHFERRVMEVDDGMVEVIKGIRNEWFSKTLGGRLKEHQSFELMKTIFANGAMEMLDWMLKNGKLKGDLTEN